MRRPRMRRMRRGEMRGSGHVVRVLLLLALLLILPVAGWGLSPMPTEALVSVMLELVARALPGGQLDFGANVVTWPDGRRERVAFTVESESPSPGAQGSSRATNSFS